MADGQTREGGGGGGTERVSVIWLRRWINTQELQSRGKKLHT